MTAKNTLHLFEGFGIELEYMIVNKNTIAVTPIADEILRSVAGEYVSDFDSDDLNWSNELVLHVIELKTNGPAKKIDTLDRSFHRDILKINAILEPFDAMLLPSAAHPFMCPFTESKLWPHDYNEVYETYNAIFDCRGHGWSNLQSTHINLPFANDEEFGKLHAAIRLILPIIPALSASSPIIDGKPTGMLDTRLEYYRTNQRKIPSISGMVIPERVFTVNDYHTKILKTIYDDIAPYDKKNIMCDDWLNSRGCIARFHRNTLEIKTIDIQECPLADMAVSAVIIDTLKALINETWLDFEAQCLFDERPLADILQSTIIHAEQAVIEDSRFLSAFGFSHRQTCTAGELWRHIIENIRHETISEQFASSVEIILNQGTLARRLLNSLDNNISRSAIMRVYGQLAECLTHNEMFVL